MENEDIFHKVLELEEAIISYFNDLNKQGVWLFLAILGAFSAPNDYLKWGAFIIIIIMVAREVVNTKAWYLAENNNFKMMLNLYENKIDHSDIDLAYKSILKERLIQLDQKYFTFGLTSLKIGINFFLAMIFLAASITYMISK